MIRRYEIREFLVEITVLKDLYQFLFLYNIYSGSYYTGTTEQIINKHFYLLKEI
jgi:hypothetical protein